jgi:type II secretory pathway component PulC
VRPCAHVVVWMLVLAGPAVCLSGEAAAQTARGAPRVSEGEQIVREWALRGVVISDAGRWAVLEHLPSGRQELLGVGAAMTRTTAVVTIDTDRIVLNAEGGAIVTLRLSHGEQGRIVRRPVPAARGVPPAMMGQRRGR